MENVSNQHLDYVKMLPIWKKCRDVAEGQEAVHAAGELYLKKVAAEPNDAYTIRLENATFYDATSRTVDGMQGMLFRKPTKIDPEEMKDNDLFTNIDGRGHTLPQFIKILSFEAEIITRFGLLTDYTTVVDGITLADTQEAGARPNILLYKAESIINWRHTVENGERQLSMVVLCEETDEYIDDFTNEKKKQYRVLDMFDGVYRVRIFDAGTTGEGNNTEHQQIGDDIFPKMDGNFFDHIPFDFFPDMDIHKSLILGLVNMNLSHYRTTALHEQCLYRLVPTLTVSGWTPKDGEVMYMGALTAQTFPDPDAKASILEPSGNFSAISDSLTAKENRMAILGSRLLAEEKKAAEAAETASIHRMGDVSTLAALSIELSNTITISVGRMLLWADEATETTITLNKDFDPMAMSPQMMTAMLQAVQAGEMSFQTWFDNLKRGEIVAEEVTADEEQERIDSRTPPTPPEVTG